MLLIKHKATQNKKPEALIFVHREDLAQGRAVELEFGAEVVEEKT